LSASLSPEPGLSPGKSGRLVITATTTDGKQWVTVGPGHGKVLFDSFTFDATVATVNKKGIVSLPADPRISETAIPHVGLLQSGTRISVPNLISRYVLTSLSPRIFRAAPDRKDSME
jgi:hypothetical protein